MWESINSISTQHRDHLTGGLYGRVELTAGTGQLERWVVALTSHYPYMPTIVAWLLIGQIPLQHKIGIDPADGNNLSVPLYQQAGNDLGADQPAAVGKRSVQVAVGIEPR
jgi:hypothetical protein